MGFLHSQFLHSRFLHSRFLHSRFLHSRFFQDLYKTDAHFTQSHLQIAVTFLIFGLLRKYFFYLWSPTCPLSLGSNRILKGHNSKEIQARKNDQKLEKNIKNQHFRPTNISKNKNFSKNTYFLKKRICE